MEVVAVGLCKNEQNPNSNGFPEEKKHLSHLKQPELGAPIWMAMGQPLGPSHQNRPYLWCRMFLPHQDGRKLETHPHFYLEVS